jgi:hypothetical protein
MNISYAMPADPVRARRLVALARIYRDMFIDPAVLELSRSDVPQWQTDEEKVVAALVEFNLRAHVIADIDRKMDVWLRPICLAARQIGLNKIVICNDYWPNYMIGRVAKEFDFELEDIIAVKADFELTEENAHLRREAVLILNIPARGILQPQPRVLYEEFYHSVGVGKYSAACNLSVFPSLPCVNTMVANATANQSRHSADYFDLCNIIRLPHD